MGGSGEVWKLSKKMTQLHVQALSTEDVAAYREAFRKSPGKYKTLQGYMLAKEMAKLS